MARFNNSHNSHDVAELLYEELKTFHNESRDDYKRLESILADQKDMLIAHSEQLIKLTQTIHGDGNKGLVDRIDSIEETQKIFEQKFADIETKEKVRAAVLGIVCALCSSIGGIITYLVSVYISLHK